MPSSRPPEGLAESLRTPMERWSIPGVAVGVLHDGRAERWGFGKANLQNGQRVTPETMFQIGSISKVFTATAVMQLVDQWRVDLDAPVRRYVPEFATADAEASERITVRHLLTHHGGFWGDDFRDYGRGPQALATYISNLRDLRQLTAPGETFHYNNAGFATLGRMLELMDGRPYEQVMAERVFRPLGLADSVLAAEEAITRPAAAGYNAPLEGGKNTVARPYAIPWATNPAGAVISTVGDLLAFARYHITGEAPGGAKPLTAAARNSMQQRQVTAANMAPAWGLGWWVKEFNGVHAIGHGGSTNGFRALLTVVPSAGFAVAVLTNGSNGSTAGAAIERWALREYLEIDVPEPKPVRMTAKQLQRFAGTFQNPSGFSCVTVDGGQLVLEGVTRSAISGMESTIPTQHAIPVGETSFMITDTVMQGSQFDYLLNADGSVRYRRNGGRLQEPVTA